MDSTNISTQSSTTKNKNSYIRKKRSSIMTKACAGVIALGFIFSIIDSVKATGESFMFHSFVLFVLYGFIAIAVVNTVATVTLNKLTKRFAAEMELIKKGDFSHLVVSKTYGNLSEVSSTVNVVLSDIRSLIDGFFTISRSIVHATAKVNTTAEEAAEAINEISKTVDEIAKGASEQAIEAQHGVEVVDKLSDQINFVFKSYNRVIEETDKISELNSIGLDSVDVLREKSNETYRSSEKIFSVVDRLANTTKDIGVFVETIETIAEQTNLLALNAAIEASRAGEAGKGFAVFADEIRKLADDSRKSTEEITNLLENIQEESQQALKAMENLKAVSNEQNAAFAETANAFNNIANAINSIIERINEVNDALIKMQNDKNNVIDAIENISSVSEQTAASSEEVAATTENQLHAIEEMSIAARNLTELVQGLDSKLRRYRIK